jgi:hypothetical protein
MAAKRRKKRKEENPAISVLRLLRLFSANGSIDGESENGRENRKW